MTSFKTHTEQPWIAIDQDAVGMRLDRYLRQSFSQVPLSRIYASIRQGEVRINRKRAQANTRLQVHDQLRIPPTMQLWTTKSENASWEECCRKTRLSIPILYEDDDIFVVDKPAGLACHGGSGVSWGMIEWLRVQYQQPKIELVHRLDRETSGVIVIARSRRALRPLHHQLREGLIEKHYVALVHGRFLKAKQMIKVPLFKYENDHRLHKVVVHPHGKSARTEASLINAGDDMSLLHLTPHTGRTHQIRVHLRHIGYPIVGDARYASFAQNRERQKILRTHRMFLHATCLAFKHPMSGISMRIDSPWPKAFLAVQRLLESTL